MANADMVTSVEALKQTIRHFCEERDWDTFHNPKDLAIGLVTEASELLELFRFVPENQLSELFARAEARERVSDELADSLFFVLRFAQKYNFDLADCLKRKLVKNATKYPVRGANDETPQAFGLAKKDSL